jgi:Fe-S-cluster containining protein
MGTLNYQRTNGDEVVEFYYPANVEWSCNDCGNCCSDIDRRTRMILLLPEDIQRIEKIGKTDFYEDWDEGNFTGIMCKKDGVCVFYTGEGCKIYDERALLCRMYPFWLEKQGSVFVFGIDNDCSGVGRGEHLDETFFAKLLLMALKTMDY